ncbi:MAG: DUF1801 domain-containing protein [bacterium]|nr:DUF1801 domain-containing protein [bacterium]
MNPEVTAYIDSQPDELRQRFSELRAMIRAAYPNATEEMYAGNAATSFPVYMMGETWCAGFAMRTKGPMLYICDQEVVDNHRDELGNLADGKSCVLYKPSKTLNAENLRRVARACLKEAAAKRT